MPKWIFQKISGDQQGERNRKKYDMISGGFVILAVQNNSLNDST